MSIKETFDSLHIKTVHIVFQVIYRVKKGFNFIQLTNISGFENKHLDKWVSEWMGLTSEQREQIFFEREKDKLKSRSIGKERGENRKVERNKLLCCYFVWHLSFNLSEFGGPTRSIKQYRYPVQW